MGIGILLAFWIICTIDLLHIIWDLNKRAR